MTVFLSSSLWNGVSGLCTILGLVTVVTAVVQWWMDRRRLVGAYIEATVSRKGNGFLIRLQNIGAVGCVIPYVFARDVALRRIDGMPSEKSLQPGQSMVFGADRWTTASNIVVVSVSHDDLRKTHIIRFSGPMNTTDETLVIGNLDHPTARDRREMKYRETDESVFARSGIAARHRTVRLPRKDEKRCSSTSDQQAQRGRICFRVH